MLEKNINTVKNKLEKVNYWQVGVVLAIVWIMWSTLTTINDNYGLQQRIDGLQEDIASLELSNQNIAFSNTFFESDEYLDLAVREQLNKIKPGENILVIPRTDETYAPITTQDIDAEKEEEKSNIQIWLEFLFNLKV